MHEIRATVGSSREAVLVVADLFRECGHVPRIFEGPGLQLWRGEWTLPTPIAGQPCRNC